MNRTLMSAPMTSPEDGPRYSPLWELVISRVREFHREPEALFWIYGFPLILAIIGGSPKRFAPFVELFRKTLERAGQGPLPVGAHSPGHVAATDEQAKEELWPHYSTLMNRIGAERGWSPIGRAHFEREAGPDGALFVGSPDTVARKIVQAVKDLGLSRFHFKYANGPLPHEKLMTSIELFGTKVAPRVREMLG